jgi:hypothetical protein
MQDAAAVVNNFILRPGCVFGPMAAMNPTRENQIEPMARYALVVLEPQKHYETGTDGKTLFQRILDNAKKDGEPSQAIQSLHENILLIPLHTDMLFLARLTVEAKNESMLLYILFLHERPDFVKVPPDAPKTGKKSAT